MHAHEAHADRDATESFDGGDNQVNSFDFLKVTIRKDRKPSDPTKGDSAVDSAGHSKSVKEMHQAVATIQATLRKRNGESNHGFVTPGF